MINKGNNPVVEKSKAFAIRCIKLRKYLAEEKREFDLSKQLLRSGTSIGANAREAQRGQSNADFGAKMNISLKEAEESLYWLELLHETDYITGSEFDSMSADCTEIIKLLTAIVKTTLTKK